MNSSCIATVSKVPDSTRMFFMIMFGINSLVASLLNITVLILFTKVRSLNNKSNYHILSLVIGDAIIGLILSPISFIQVSSKNFHNCFVNKLGSFLVSLLGVSAFTVISIAYDRYINLTELERYDIFMTKRRFLVLLLFPWCTPLILVFGNFSGKEIFTWMIILIYFFHYFLLIYSYSKIATALRGRSITVVANAGVVLRQNEKSIRFISLLIGVFLFLSSGIAIYRILTVIDLYLPNGLRWYRKNEAFILATGQLLFQTNSVCNPMLYFIKHSDIKQAFRRLLHKRRATVSTAVVEFRR